jgi:hypothetical protein
MNLLKGLSLSTLVISIAGIGGLASGLPAPVLPTPAAHVYVVYSGTASHADFSALSTSTTTTSTTQTLYLVIDLANPSSFSFLRTRTDGTYDIFTRVLSSDDLSVAAYRDGVTETSVMSTDPDQNLIAGLANEPKAPSTIPTKAYALFVASDADGVDTVTINSTPYTYTEVRQASLTGLQTGLSTTAATTLVAASTKPKTSGVYTINVIPAALTNYIGTVGNASTKKYPTSLSGSDLHYDYNSTLGNGVPKIITLGVTGTVTVTLNTTLTSLANVGGSFKLKGQSSATTINPVAGQLNSSSSPTVYEDFLFEIVQSLNLPIVYTPSP